MQNYEDRELPPGSAPRGRSDWGVALRIVLGVLGGLGLVVALVAGLLWWNYPARRLDRAVDRFPMPEGVRRDAVVMNDNGWLCFDSCSWVEAYYVTTLPPDELAPLLEEALRDAGLDDGSGMRPCVGYGESPTRCTLSGPTEYGSGRVEYEMDIRGNGSSGWVNVGIRADGTYGVAVTLVKD